MARRTGRSRVNQVSGRGRSSVMSPSGIGGRDQEGGGSGDRGGGRAGRDGWRGVGGNGPARKRSGFPRKVAYRIPATGANTGPSIPLPFARRPGDATNELAPPIPQITSR